MSRSELSSVISRSLDSRRFRLIILPTEGCNFRCTYCYETFEHGMMKPEMVDALKKLISRRVDDLSHLTIDWFGGEPLLARSIIHEICNYVNEIKPSDLTFQSKITTNGYLLDQECLTELVGLGVSSYQISLDGWATGHDETRLRVNGGGSFDKIWNNLLSASQSSFPFRIILRVHFQPSNIDSVRHLLKEISREFGDDERFQVFLKAVGHYGGPNDETFAVYDLDERKRLQQELLTYVDMSSPTTNDNNHLPYICYASQPNSLVVRSTGRIAKCTVALDNPTNDVGELHLDGTLSFNSDRLQQWFVGLETLNPSHLACPWSHIEPG